MTALASETLDFGVEWPGRESQIKQLLSLLTRQASSLPNILIHGPASTGKTSITRYILGSLKRPYVYVSCTEFSKPRQLLHSILNQIKSKKRKRSEGYAGTTRSDQLAELVAEFPVSQNAGSAKLVVVDHAHNIADQDVLAILLRLKELTGAKLSVILISRLSWAAGGFDTNTLRAPRPVQVHFPAYEASQIASILATSPPPEIEEYGTDVFKSFLRAEILSVFTRTSRRIEDIQGLVNALFPLYLQPVTEGLMSVAEGRKLHAAFQPILMAAKASFDSGCTWRGTIAQLNTKTQRSSSQQRSNELGFELPYYSKFLLLSAYICSRNKPTLDRRLFDPRSRSGKRHGQLSHDKQAENAREAALKGPHSFPLERLLGVFWHLQRAEDESEAAAGLNDAELFMQITSLCSLQFLTKVSSDDLEAKYRCNLSESVASVIARNLSLRLSDYVLYA